MHGERQRGGRDGGDARGRGRSSHALAFACGRVYALDGAHERGKGGGAHRCPRPRGAKTACFAVSERARRSRAHNAEPRGEFLRHGERRDALWPCRHEGAARRCGSGRRAGGHRLGRYVHVPFAEFFRRGASADERARAARRCRGGGCLLCGAADVHRLASAVVLCKLFCRRRPPGLQARTGRLARRKAGQRA